MIQPQTRSQTFIQMITFQAISFAVYSGISGPKLFAPQFSQTEQR